MDGTVVVALSTSLQVNEPVLLNIFNRFKSSVLNEQVKGFK